MLPTECGYWVTGQTVSSLFLVLDSTIVFVIWLGGRRSSLSHPPFTSLALLRMGPDLDMPSSPQSLSILSLCGFPFVLLLISQAH